VIGSKNFTESRILGEMMALLVEAHTDMEVDHRSGLGGTLVCFTALERGEIDLYAEYTGTAWAIILNETDRIDDPCARSCTCSRRSAIATISNGSRPSG
jgi:glycine betaine/choline ABC-type transport system substrate-binding protein